MEEIIRHKKMINCRKIVVETTSYIDEERGEIEKEYAIERECTISNWLYLAGLLCLLSKVSYGVADKYIII